jgi:hypothetical protein
MAEEIKKVITIDTKGADSVKDLIDKVEKLRGILKTLDETSDEYKSTLGELKAAQDSLTSSLGENKTKAEAAEGSYNALAQQMKVLKKEWKATSDEATRNALGKEIKGINDQLKVLDQSIGNNQRNVGNYAGSFQSLKEEIRQARDIMAGAARGSDEYAAAAKRAADAADKLKDMQMEISNGASGLDNQFSVMTNMLGSVSGGFAAVQGAMALFGAESENLQKTFVKLQAAMSMTQGFKALAELPKALNAAKIAFGGATTGVKNFIKGLNGVKGAIAATGIGILLVLLGELIANWDAVSEAVSNFVGGMDGLTEKLAGVANVIKNFITGPIKALGLALKGNFSEAWEAMKDGFKISANYVEGRNAQMVKNVQKAEQKKREEYDKTKDDYIKDMEAQYGADWKYTKDGQKAYREYFNNKLSMYKKDSEEYKKAQRDMWTYERELKEQATKGSGKSGGSKTKTGKSEAQKELEEQIKASEEEYKRLAELRKTERQKIQEDYEERLKLLKVNLDNGKRTLEDYNKAVETLTEERNKAIAEIEKKEQQELYENAVKALASLQTKNEKALAKVRADIADNMFPGVRDAELAAKKLNTEEIMNKFLTLDGHRKKFNIGDWVIWDEKDFYTLNDYLTILAVKLNDLNYYAETGNARFATEFTTFVAQARLASEAMEKMVEKRDQLLDALLHKTVDDSGIEKLQEELDNLTREYQSALSDITKKGIEDLDNLAETSVKNAEGWMATFFDWRVLKGEEVVKNEIANNNLELASFIATSEERIRQIQEELTTENLAEEEKLNLYKEVEEIKRSELQKTAEVEQKNAEITLNTIRKVEEGKKQLVAKTAEAIGNTGNFLMNWSDNIVKNETKNGQKMSKEKEKQAENMFNVGKALAISEAVVSTYQGAQEAFTSLASIPYVGPALGIAAAAAAVTAGMLRIQSIASQKFGDQGSVSDTSSSVGITSAVAVPQLESTPYSYTSTITDAKDEDELNKPVIVKVVDIEDAMKVQESRQVETSF